MFVMNSMRELVRTYRLGIMGATNAVSKKVTAYGITVYMSNKFNNNNNNNNNFVPASL